MRQRFIVDLKEFDSILSDRATRRHDADDWLPFIRGDVLRERVIRKRRSPRNRTQNRERLRLAQNVGTDQYLLDPDDRRRTGDIDRTDARMREWAACDGHLQLVGELDIVDESAIAP